MKKRTAMISSFLACLLVIIGLCPAWEQMLEKGSILPKAYAASPTSEEAAVRPTKYVIALDNSGSMSGVVKERNAAARALIYSLPYEENVQATVFFFTSEARAPVDLLPMNQENERQKLLDLLDDDMEVKGGTDLGVMLEKALEKFGDGQDGRQALFVVTDGGNDGTPSEIVEKDKNFFNLCAEARDNQVNVYIVYVSEDESLGKLEKGLKTTAITLDESSEDSISRLTVWREEEKAKILLIPSVDNLEAALLNLRFSDADAVFNRKIMEDGTVSFPVFSLCAQEITIAVSGGSAKDAILSVKVDGGEDLLSQDGGKFTNSGVTLRNQKGFPNGLYTVDVQAERPFSMVIACRYNYQLRYSFLETEDAGEPPAGLDATLHMLAVDPDGNELPADGSVSLSMNVYDLDDSGAHSLLREIRDGDTLPGSLLKADVPLELRPVVAYGGISEERSQSWTIQPTDLPPILDDKSGIKLALFSGAKGISLGKINDIVADRETPAEDILISNMGDGPALEKREDKLFLVDKDGGNWLLWKTYHISAIATDASGQSAVKDWSVTVVAVLPIILGILGIVIAVCLVGWIYFEWQEKRDAKKRVAELKQREREAQKQLYLKEVEADRSIFIRAGLCWTVRNSENETTHIGGLGLTDEKGQIQGGCDLSKVLVYCLDETGGVTDCPNPLEFGRWRYSETHNCTELLLRASTDVSDCGIEELKRVIKNPEEKEGDIICFGVNQALPSREVQMETSQGTITFRLEYYTDNPPFYF